MTVFDPDTTFVFLSQIRTGEMKYNGNFSTIPGVTVIRGFAARAGMAGSTLVAKLSSSNTLSVTMDNAAIDLGDTSYAGAASAPSTPVYYAYPDVQLSWTASSRTLAAVWADGVIAAVSQPRLDGDPDLDGGMLAVRTYMGACA
jgi:hypothetical protein